ncbi:hypothetical protein [Pseudonocardia endophytica]|uniref:Uncharacterized protein n=1 Tax=Pseudonocardia endophytica TaxID=401976 RepID=A0A4R1I8Z2_PSEEN|nr:hypothetical protein [Pseudonocardia endophytica]TCK26672.1 hypothetical protein EV378_2513 [Pseudonocardia endophytica]
MTRRRATAVCLAVLALAMVCSVLTVVVRVGRPLVGASPAEAISGGVLFNTSLLFVALGTLIVLRGAGHRIGWVLVGTGGVLAVETLASTVGTTYMYGQAVPLGQWAAWVDDFAWAPLLWGVWATLVLFPDGRVPGRFGRVVLAVATAVAGAIVVVLPFHSGMLVDYPTVASPVPPVPVLTPVAEVAAVPLQVATSVVFVLAASVTVLRYRASGPEQRAQLRWLGWYGVVLATSVLLSQAVGRGLITAAPWPDVVQIGTGLTLPLLPVVIAVAVLRYRLYDIDRLVSRTVSYALLTGAVVAVYVAVVAAASVLVPDAAGSLGVAAATLAAVSLVGPLRRRLQAVVDRRFDRERHEAHRAVAAYADRLRADPGRDTEAELLTVLDHAVAPTRAWLWRPAPAPVLPDQRSQPITTFVRNTPAGS